MPLGESEILVSGSNAGLSEVVATRRALGVSEPAIEIEKVEFDTIAWLSIAAMVGAEGVGRFAAAFR